MPWTEMQNNAMYSGATWGNVITKSSMTVESAKAYAAADKNITCFFLVYPKSQLVLEPHGVFKAGDAVFFSVAPWTAPAVRIAAMYVKVVPTIAAISPQWQFPAGQIQIMGTGFSPIAAENSVTFAGNVTTKATSVNGDGTQLTVTVPDGAQTGPLTVTVTSDGVSSQPSHSSFTALRTVLALNSLSASYHGQPTPEAIYIFSTCDFTLKNTQSSPYPAQGTKCISVYFYASSTNSLPSSLPASAESLGMVQIGGISVYIATPIAASSSLDWSAEGNPVGCNTYRTSATLVWLPNMTSNLTTKPSILTSGQYYVYAEVGNDVGAKVIGGTGAFTAGQYQLPPA